MSDDLTARLRVTYAAHVPDPDQDDDAPFDMLASEMRELTALLLEAAEALTAERQARDRLRERLAHHLTENDDPCQDRGASWPCDVARALLGHEEPR